MYNPPPISQDVPIEDDEKLAPPPQYEEATPRPSSDSPDRFVTTSELQIQATGYDMNQALTGNMLENITVERVSSGQNEYTSVRLKRSSNSCALVHASDPNRTLISTIYRWGPGRRPKMHILPNDAVISVEQALENEKIPGEVVGVKSRTWYSRDQIFDTSLGQFTWSYADRHERHEAGADSLMVMERIDGNSKAGVTVAQFIRNDELRTPGSKKYSGGNGGRLIMDLRMWNDEKTAGAGIEAFVVASCILMLKREADRFINNNVAAVS